MKEYDEMREAVVAEYGAPVSSALVDRALKEAYSSLGEMPKPQPRPLRRALRSVGIAAAACAAGLCILVGVSAANPALAEQLPFLGNIVAFLKGGGSQSYQSPILTQGGTEEYYAPVTGEAQNGFRVSGVYCDGKTLILGIELQASGAPEEVRFIDADLGFLSGETELLPSRALQGRLYRTESGSFVGASILDLTGKDLGGSFPLTVTLRSAVGKNPKLMILEAGSYREKTYDLGQRPAAFTLQVRQDDSLIRTYDVNETQNGCTLKQVKVTPALTELTLDADSNNVVALAYDADGVPLEQLSKYAQDGGLGIQYYLPLEKDATAVVVKFFAWEDRNNPVAEFTVPVEGGYGNPSEESAWLDDGEPIVYDPPRQERDAIQIKYSEAPTVGLGETLTTTEGVQSGSLDITVDNMRIYNSITDAGIALEDLADPQVSETLSQDASLKFVLFDVALQGHGAISCWDSQSKPQYNDALAEEGTYWITSLLGVQAQDESAADTETLLKLYRGVSYFSEHMDGVTNYNHFLLGADEAKTVQVGFFVPESQLEGPSFNFMLLVFQQVDSPADIPVAAYIELTPEDSET